MDNSKQVLTQEAVAFLAKLHRRYNDTRVELLKKRHERQKAIDAGIFPDFLPETAHIRQDPSWKVAESPHDLQKRYVEITGPVEKKMMINALNSGADTFMADFEDALSPTWSNVIEGQLNLTAGIERRLSYTSPEGKQYRQQDKTATLIVRPRGWHLDEKHLVIDGKPISASIFDFGLYFFHNAHRLLEKGTGPYFYLPKLESHLEARLWNDIFITAQEELGIARGTIRATVLIETILAAFEMEEILYELKEHCVGLNAGRWDYIFSIIKKFQKLQDFTLPDRAQITMTVPFMRSYTNLLIQTCHKRGAHAMGGMAAFVPSRKNVEINATALQKVTEDKERESKDGFDGTWVAHPDLVPVAMEVFVRHLQQRPHQKERLREDVAVTSRDLLEFKVPDGEITEKGLHQNISVCLQYLESWLRGQGAVALFNLMEDTATAEICRAQIWQWLHHKKIDRDLYSTLAAEELKKLGSSYELAFQIMDRLVTQEQFEEFLTLSAYTYLE
ncbi:MAG: malate synthase A [Verrucomicrobia bacterium]|nr:malate synthase A [Verrucomicrobiota bacterium]